MTVDDGSGFATRDARHPRVLCITRVARRRVLIGPIRESGGDLRLDPRPLSHSIGGTSPTSRAVSRRSLASLAPYPTSARLTPVSRFARPLPSRHPPFVRPHVVVVGRFLPDNERANRPSPVMSFAMTHAASSALGAKAPVSLPPRKSVRVAARRSAVVRASSDDAYDTVIVGAGVPACLPPHPRSLLPGVRMLVTEVRTASAATSPPATRTGTSGRRAPTRTSPATPSSPSRATPACATTSSSPTPTPIATSCGRGARAPPRTSRPRSRHVPHLPGKIACVSAPSASARPPPGQGGVRQGVRLAQPRRGGAERLIEPFCRVYARPHALLLTPPTRSASNPSAEASSRAPSRHRRRRTTP